jgi:hypothetical protein
VGNIVLVSLICREHITAAEAEEKIRKQLDPGDFRIEKVAVLNGDLKPVPEIQT